jgi:hypothetical protein
MALSLVPHVHAAVVGGDVVLLDVRGDEYFCVRDGVQVLGLAEDHRALEPPDAAVGDALVEDGLAVRGPPPEPARQLPPPPGEDLPAGVAQPLSRRELAALCGAVWDYLAHYRGRSFAQVLAYVGAARSTVGRKETLRLAGVFARAAPWLPIPHQCLVRSFVLLRFLQRSGADAQWVLGVRTWPFAAHCWLQLGRVVLDDSTDRLAVYQPILVVGR